jgi:hypothetical protein
VIGANVLRDSTGLAGDDVRFPDVVEERRLAVIDVAHDGDDGRPRHQLLGGVLAWRGRVQIGGVLLFLHRLESEFAGNELDLIEVKALIDGDHQAEILERESDDLDGLHLEDLGQLVDGDELVDAHRLLFALDLGLTLGGHLFAVATIFGTTSAAATDRSAHRRHGLADVRRHGFLIDTALALLATTGAAVFTAPRGTVFATRRRAADAGCR